MTLPIIYIKFFSYFSFNSIRDNLIESEKTDCEPNGFIGAGKDTSRPAPPLHYDL
ncbi:hypothetical protein ECDEC1B_3122 [Escherichia coli DEC1B]|nr:hypothetical protein ECDEC1B_3122 [Escherichia coli DEC1B]